MLAAYIVRRDFLDDKYYKIHIIFPLIILFSHPILSQTETQLCKGAHTIIYSWITVVSHPGTIYDSIYILSIWWIRHYILRKIKFI